MHVYAKISGPEAIRIADGLGLDQAGDQTDINTKVFFTRGKIHVSNQEIDYVEVEMEI